MAKKIESFMYPDQIFLAEVDGQFQFFKEDPLKTLNREEARIDLGAALTNFLGGGHCTVGNPIIIKIRAARIDRCRPFEISAPQNIRRGALAAHFEDLDGNYVEILPAGTGIFDFPFLGAVVRKDGTPVGFRSYSVRGESMDEDPNHRIFLLDGVIAVETPKQEKEEGDEGESGDEAAKTEEAPKAEKPEKPEKPSRRRGILSMKKKEEAHEAGIFDDQNIAAGVEEPEDM